jgi:hypothetical protein
MIGSEVAQKENESLQQKEAYEEVQKFMGKHNTTQFV